jgi:hypothetical protein
MKAPAPELTSFEARRTTRPAPQDEVDRSRGASSAPELCQAIPTNEREDSLPAITGKRSAERRIVQPCPHRQTSLRNSSVRGCVPLSLFAARRLSALTLAALATGYYPDGSAPEPDFPRRAAKQAFLPLRQPKRKTMPRLSTLRADRSLCRSTGDPKPPGSGLAKRSARGDRISPSLLRHAVRNGALHKARFLAYNRNGD